MGVPANELVKKLMMAGEMLTVNQMMTDEAIEFVVRGPGLLRDHREPRARRSRRSSRSTTRPTSSDVRRS